MSMSRAEIERLLITVTSGDYPRIGTTLVYTRLGWTIRGATAVLDADGDAQIGEYLDIIPLFDMDGSGDNPLLKLQDVVDLGNQGSNFAIDATAGGAQKAILTASVTLTAITGLVGVEPLNLQVDLSGGAYTLTLNPTNFGGPQLSFSGVNACAISFVDFDLAGGIITAMGQDW